MSNTLYVIVSGDSKIELCRKVQEKLKYGAELCGGLSVIYHVGFGQTMFYQAMTIRED